MKTLSKEAYKPPKINNLNQIRTVAPLEFLCRIFTLLALGALAAYGIIATHGGYSIPFQVLMAFTLAHGTELAHQCLHKTGTGSILVDHALGIALCWPTAVCFGYYKWCHLWHHAENGTDDDAESFGYTYLLMQNKHRLIRLMGFGRHALMLDHYWNTLRRLQLAVCGKLAANLRKEMPQMSISAARQIQREYVGMALIYSAVIGISCATGSAVLLRLWIIPALLWAPIHALIELPEHWATAPRPNGNSFENTRTVRASRFANWFTNANCYHVEHHAYSAIPMQRLAALHQSLVREGAQYRYLENNYRSFYLDFFASLWSGRS